MASMIKAIILDWAGTTVDFGSRAPTQIFLEIFQRRGLEITIAEARGPMGRAKHEHIEMVASLPRVTEAWRELYGQPPTDDDFLSMYEDFLPLQKEILAEGSNVIPGISEAMRELRGMGLKIGSSTGYTRELMDVVVPLASAQGYEPDAVVCADEVTAGRPAPWMNLRNAELLNVYPLNSILVVDDTVVGIEAGFHAGMKTVGVTMTGNELGLSLEEVQQMSPEELHARLQLIEQRFLNAGADYVVSSVVELPELVRSMRSASLDLE